MTKFKNMTPQITRKKKTLYHATTQKKAKRYKESGKIISPVRGFTTIEACMFWALKVGRSVILSFDAYDAHKLPDHHNQFGEAWWNDGDITDYQIIR